MLRLWKNKKQKRVRVKPLLASKLKENISFRKNLQANIFRLVLFEFRSPLGLKRWKNSGASGDEMKLAGSPEINRFEMWLRAALGYYSQVIWQIFQKVKEYAAFAADLS